MHTETKQCKGTRLFVRMSDRQTDQRGSQGSADDDVVPAAAAAAAESDHEQESKAATTTTTTTTSPKERGGKRNYQPPNNEDKTAQQAFADVLSVPPYQIVDEITLATSDVVCFITHPATQQPATSSQHAAPLNSGTSFKALRCPTRACGAATRTLWRCTTRCWASFCPATFLCCRPTRSSASRAAKTFSSSATRHCRSTSTRWGCGRLFPRARSCTTSSRCSRWT